MMNERIRELAEQADIFADSKLQMKGEFHPDWHDIRDEKFAELIVRECAKLADKESSYPYSSYGLLIKEQFGVK
jgi:hypothetical protein